MAEQGTVRFLEALKANAYFIQGRDTDRFDGETSPDECTRHENCVETMYFVSVIMTHGSDKSHRMIYNHHSSDDSVLGGSRPGCGSKQWGAPASYNMRQGRPTCGRC